MNSFLLQLLTLLTTGAFLSASSHWERIYSRDDPNLNGSRFPLYRALTPDDWQQEENPTTVSNTTLPIISFLIQKTSGTLRLTVHNFPYDSPKESIPPMAQVARWQKQSNTKTAPIPVNSGGFIGLHLASEGLLAWSLQLAEEHRHSIESREHRQNRHYCRQIKADYTIKVTGDEATLKAAYPEIKQFVSSFGLIHKIPF